MDIWSKKKRSAVMAKIRSKDTKPEWIVRRYLFSRGYRYRKNVKGLPGTPDIVLRKYGIVIFIHGCFPFCALSTISRGVASKGVCCLI